MQHWEPLCVGGLSFVCDGGLFRPGTDSFLLGSFPRLKPGLRVCDLGSGTGLLGLLLLQRQRELSVTVWSCCRRPSVWRSRPPPGTA